MLISPTLLVDKNICLRNIERMVSKAKASNTILRPHFKTHQSVEIGRWFRDFGVDCITVSSIKMANYFAEDGWKDITVAFPVNILEWRDIDRLAKKINLNILIENPKAVKFLENHLNNPVGVYIKTDTGHGRTGVDAEDFDSFQEILTLLKPSKKLILLGFLTFAGHTYHAESTSEINAIKADAIRKLLALKTFFRSDFPLLQLSYGDTPSCSIAKDFDEFDEIRPGNFVFHDEMQFQLGVCRREDIGVALASPVVAIHGKRNEIVIHGGAIHLSKESITDELGDDYYGMAVTLNNYSWDVNNIIGKVTKLSQEHGVVKVSGNIDSISIGDMIAVLPIHSCLTANLINGYITTNGNRIDSNK